ncbi:MAG: hypothetical protein JSS30_02385 [Verrucomicrobia bacterium]|nr:hypothetical protein [Verrucomicrobiota bacterium]
MAEKIGFGDPKNGGNKILSQIQDTLVGGKNQRKDAKSLAQFHSKLIIGLSNNGF